MTSTPSLTSLRRSKAARHTVILKLLDELQNAIQANDLVEVEAKMEIVKVKEAELTAIHMQLESLDEDLSEEDVVTMSNFRDSIVAMKVTANRALKSAAISNPSSGQAKTQAKLPKLQIRKFDGSIRDWERFWQQFASGVHDNSSLSNADKMNYLRSLVTENAALTFAGLELTGSNYAIAVDLLSEKYGRPEVLQTEHFNSLTRLRRPADGSASELRKLYEEIGYRTRALSVLGIDLELSSGIICSSVLQVLPDTQIKEWHRDEARSKDPKLSQMLLFLKREVEILEGLERTSTSRGVEKEAVQPRKKVFAKVAEKKVSTASSLVASEMKSQEKSSPVKFCAFCEIGDHWSRACQVHSSLAERRDVLKRLNKCYKCLKSDHWFRDCKSKIVCRNCRQSHHAAMCPQEKETAACNLTAQRKTETKPQSELKEEVGKGDQVVASVVHNVCNVSRQMDTTILQTLELRVVNKGKSALVHCLIDGGSERSFITTHVATSLQLPVVSTRALRVNSFGGGQETRSGNQVKVPLVGLQGVELTIDAFEVQSICHNVSFWETSKIERLLQGRQGTWNRVMGPAHRVSIDLLIGADWYWRIVTGHMKRLSSFLMATESIFGWTLQGRALSRTQECSAVQMFVSTQVIEEKLDDEEERRQILLSHLIDNNDVIMNEDSKMSWGEESVLREFDQSTIFKEGRYEVTIPWNEKKNQLCRNFGTAETRLRRLLHKLKKDEVLLQRYTKGVYTYLEDEHSEEVTEQEPLNEPVYYMPHHPIIKEDRKTTKLRIVFDASSHEEGHHSLNECQEAGPNLNPDIVDLLLRFRQSKIAMISDITKAFLQVKLQKEDRNATRFLWTDDGKDWRSSASRKIFRMTRVLFGMKASPFLLAATIRLHARKYALTHAEAARILDEQMYVDDCLSSTDTVEEAYQLRTDLKSIMKEGGFSLVKWMTNSRELRRRWSNEEAPIEQPVELLKVLGLLWDPDADNLQFKSLSTNLVESTNTKREILSISARVFDPLGFIAPFLLLARILLQELWRSKVGWDDTLNEELTLQWQTWKENAKFLEQVSVPRWLQFTKDNTKILHIFCDASLSAFGCVAYAQVTTGSQKMEIVACKARVAPLKTVSLPRLELLACLEGAKLWHRLQKAWNTQFSQVNFWTDSTIALQWIQQRSAKWKLFVARRVQQIQQLTIGCRFRHCSSQQNAADIVSRGCQLQKLLHNKLWWGGPTWLQELHNGSDENPELSEEEWECVNKEEIVEVAKCQLAIEEIPDLLPWKNFSSWRKLVRVTGWIFRFLRNTRSRIRSEVNVLTAEELRMAKCYWFKVDQKHEFPEELKQLENNEVLSRKSSIFKFQPRLGEDGLIRLGGRLRNTDLPEQQKYAILLRGTGAASLYILHLHEMTLHAGVQQTLHRLRREVWLLRGRQQVRRILRSCKKCCRWEAKAADADEAPLPPERVIGGIAFETCGVDHAGPLWVKEGAKQKKMYVCLFTCATSRAVHLELASSLSADSFLLSFRRFLARRAGCRVIFSDNAKCFEQACHILHNAHEKNSRGRIQQWAAERGIVWKFIPPRAAWWGGFYERLIGTMKRHLRRTLGQAVLTEEELLTVLCEVEFAMNSRPLTSLTEDPADLDALTPFHLLLGKESNEMWDCEFNPTIDVAENMLCKRWRYRRRLVNQFWKRWQEEYLLQLRTAHEVRQQRGGTQELTENELVLIYNDKLPRGRWRLGRVLRLIPGRDGKTRSVVLRVDNGEMRRAIQHCYPLESNI